MVGFIQLLQSKYPRKRKLLLDFLQNEDKERKNRNEKEH